MNISTPYERTEHYNHKYIDIPANRVRQLNLYGYVFNDSYGSYLKQTDGTKLYLLNQLAA